MGLMRYSVGVAAAALLGGTALAQTAPATAPQAAPAVARQSAGTLDPAAESAPQTAPAAAEPEFQLEEGVMATVNDRIVTAYDLRQRMLLLIAMTQVQPTAENLPAIQQQALAALIEQHLQQEELERFEVEISDEEIAAELQAVAQEQGTTAENYLAFMQQIGIRPETVIGQMRSETGWRALVSGRFNTQSQVSRSQVEQYMRQQGEAAAKPQYLVGEIYIEAARVGGQQAALNGAQQLVTQMVQGAPFQAVARQFSAAPSAARGGDAGWLVQGEVAPQLQTALDSLNAGQLSQPIPVEGGVYILYVRDKRSGAATTLVQMKQIMIEAPEMTSEADVAAATQRLLAIRDTLTCDSIIPRASSEPGLLGADLGESDVANLAPQFQQVARSAEVGSISQPVRTPLGVHLLAVCGRRVGGADALSYEQVENRLQNQNLAMLARRYIRDLQASALIEYK